MYRELTQDLPRQTIYIVVQAQAWRTVSLNFYFQKQAAIKEWERRANEKYEDYDTYCTQRAKWRHPEYYKIIEVPMKEFLQAYFKNQCSEMETRLARQNVEKAKETLALREEKLKREGIKEFALKMCQVLDEEYGLKLEKGIYF